MNEVTEHGEQSTVIAWARIYGNQYPCLKWLFAIPNGASLSSKAEARKLLEEGMTPGICDLFLPWPAQNYHGFFIEMKRPGNMEGVRPGQKEFMRFCEDAGYLAQVFDNADDAIEALKWYLGIP